ncbi:MAG: hypothetical protein PHY16_02905 [Methylobacter sp.]|nr:hypothetical protein [Methylobacter sp.]
MSCNFQDRHSGKDCRTNSPGANLDVHRTGRSPNRREAVSNPESRDRFELAIPGAGYPLPAGHDELS